MRINRKRLQDTMDALGRIGETPAGGLTRLALSDEDRRGRDLLVGWMREAGLRVSIDQMGNIMATRITAARLLAYRAADRLDEDEHDPIGTLMARIDAVETAASVTLEAMRIHGGYGYTREFSVERFYRDAGWLMVSPRTLDLDRRELARRWHDGITA